MENWKIVKTVRKIKIFDIAFSFYFKYEEVLNYLIAGGLATVFNIGLYYILARVIHIDYMTATIISWIFTVIFAFITNKIFVFKSKVKGNKLVKELYNFFKFRIFSLVIEVGLMYAFVDIIHMNDVIAKIIVQFVVIALNYIFSKLFIFKKE